jgi:hypothetical protein
MVGLADDDQHTPSQSPHTKGIVQTFVREVKKHMKGHDNDVHMTNEKIGVLEATQLATDTKLGIMEAFIARMTRDHDRQQGHNNYNNNHLIE